MISKGLGFLTLSSILAVPQSAFAEVSEEYLETPLATAFGEPPTIANPMLSPDGTRLIFMQQNPLGISMLLTVNIADGAVDIVMEPIAGGYDMLWCRFANQTRVLCDQRQVGPPNRNVDYHRYVAVNADGTELREMPQAIGCQRHDFLRDQPFVEWVPDDPEQILLLCPMGSPPLGSPKLLDVYTGRVRETRGAAEFGGPGTDYFEFGRRQILTVHHIPPGPGEMGRRQVLYSNGHGLANLYSGRQDNVDRWFVRDSGRSGWQDVLEIDPLAFESPFRPVGYGRDLDRVFNSAWDPVAQAWSLYSQDLTGGEDERENQRANERVFARSGVDIELVDTMGRHQRVVAAAFLEGRPRRAIVDPRIAEVYESLSAQLSEFEVEIVDESWDQNRYLVRTRAPNRAGEFVLVDMENANVHPIGPEYAHLSDVELAGTTFVEFEASTGGLITGNLTLPQSVDGPVPTVIMPRPSASHEDVADPHYLVQFLAANGYAVFRVSNRVEEEYGRGWVPERAVMGWNQSADDINDAARFLVKNGISASGMICGAGKNYGAYVALMSAIKYPDLFNCVVSIAGVADPRETPGGTVVIAGGNRSLLPEASPVRRVAELNAPILLFHGWGDADFSVADHSLKLATELEIAEKDVTFVEYPYANHEIRQRSYRIDMLARIRGFLAEHIGPPLTNEEAANGVARWRLSREQTLSDGA